MARSSAKSPVLSSVLVGSPSVAALSSAVVAILAMGILGAIVALPSRPVPGRG